MKNKMGRPPEDDPKSVFIQIRTTKEEREYLEEAWNRDRVRGEKLSPWLRRKLIELSEDILSKK